MAYTWAQMRVRELGPARRLKKKNLQYFAHRRRRKEPCHTPGTLGIPRSPLALDSSQFLCPAGEASRLCEACLCQEAGTDQPPRM